MYRVGNKVNVYTWKDICLTDINKMNISELGKYVIKKAIEEYRKISK